MLFWWLGPKEKEHNLEKVQKKETTQIRVDHRSEPITSHVVELKDTIQNQNDTGRDKGSKEVPKRYRRYSR